MTVQEFFNVMAWTGNRNLSYFEVADNNDEEIRTLWEGWGFEANECPFSMCYVCWIAYKKNYCFLAVSEDKDDAI